MGQEDGDHLGTYETIADIVLNKIAGCEIYAERQHTDESIKYHLLTSAKVGSEEYKKQKFFYRKLKRKTNLLYIYNRLLDKREDLPLNRSTLPGFVYLAKKIYVDNKFFKVIKYISNDKRLPSVKDKLKYEEDYNYRNYAKRKNPVDSYLSMRYSEFKYSTRADAVYKQYLHGILKALNASIEPHLQDWQHKERPIISSNVTLCLQTIGDFEKREPDFQNAFIKSTDLLGNIVHLNAYVDTVHLLRSELPIVSEESPTSSSSEVNQNIDATADRVSRLKNEFKSLKIFLQKEGKKPRTNIINPKFKNQDQNCEMNKN